MNRFTTSASIAALIAAGLSSNPCWAQESAPAAPKPGEQSTDQPGAESEGGRRARDEVVVTGRRAARSISSIPNSISVIGTEELTAQFGVDENLNSLLTFNVPGFAGRSSSIQQRAVLRGRTALILIDGVPQNQLLRSSGFDIQTIAPEAIDRVEVLRGANAVFGFGATGGVVNFITKRPPTDGFEFIGKARTAFQTSNVEPSREIYGQASGRIGRLGVLIGAGFDDLEPAFDGDGAFLPNESTEFGKDILNVHGAIDFEISPTQRLRATANYFDRKDVLEDYAIIDALGDPAAGAFTTARFADAFFTDFDAIYYGTEEVDPATLPFDLPGGAQTFTNATLSYQNDDVLGSSLEVTGLFHDFDLTFPFSLFDGINLRQVRERQRYGVRTAVDTPLRFLREGARLVWGADYVVETVDEGGNIGDPALGIVEGTRTTIRVSPFVRQRAAGFWGGLEVPLGPFLLSGGVRHDIIDATLDDANFDAGGFFQGGEVDYSATVFNAGLIYYVSPALDLYVSYTQGFDVTDIGRAAFQVDSATEINPEPAITDQFEVGARGRVNDFSVALAGFYADSELAARTVRVPGISIALPLRQPEQVWGVEASWAYAPDRPFDFGGTFTWNDGRRELPDGTTRPVQNNFLSPLTVTAYANWRPTQWFDGRIQLAQNFGSDDFDGSAAFGEGNFEDLTQVDLLARFKSRRLGSFEVGVDNLLNVVDVAPGDRASNIGFNFFPITGRTVSLTYRYQFRS